MSVEIGAPMAEIEEDSDQEVVDSTEETIEEAIASVIEDMVVLQDITIEEGKLIIHCLICLDRHQDLEVHQDTTQVLEGADPDLEIVDHQTRGMSQEVTMLIETMVIVT